MSESLHFVHAPYPTARFIVKTDASQVATDLQVRVNRQPGR